MAARSIASLSLSFGLVSIPVKLYSATESSSGVKFNMLSKEGSRLKQQYISETTREVVERADMVKGYEFEKDRYVIFTSEELKALDEASSHVIEIVSFIPETTLDPIYYDKAYLLAPDKRGAKPYTLLMQAMRTTGRCALAKWAWKGKQYVVQVRPAQDGLVLQQLLYADEVRSLKDLDIEQVTVTEPELNLAMQLIAQISQDTYEPGLFEDDEKKRILAAIDAKISGQQVVSVQPAEASAAVGGGQVIDLMDALRASLGNRPAAKARTATAAATTPAAAPEPAANVATLGATGERKGVKRAAKAEPAEAAPAAPARARARK